MCKSAAHLEMKLHRDSLLLPSKKGRLMACGVTCRMCAQVEKLQAQVRVLQAVGYGAVEADESGGVPSAGAGAADSLEAALLGKARRLEHELTMARLRIAELAGTPP